MRHKYYRKRKAARAVFFGSAYDVGYAFRWMLNHKNWRRHSAPFSKTEAGRLRRTERKLSQEIDHQCLE